MAVNQDGFDTPSISIDVGGFDDECVLEYFEGGKLVAVSNDYGKTWTPVADPIPDNLSGMLVSDRFTKRVSELLPDFSGFVAAGVTYHANSTKGYYVETRYNNGGVIFGPGKEISPPRSPVSPPDDEDA